jgi:magnesium transporter
MITNKAEPREGEDPSHGLNLRVPCLTQIDEPQIRDLLEHDHFFWLDLGMPTKEDVIVLGRIFGFHPLALEDTLHFHQRPKLDDYGDYVYLVFYGAREHTEHHDDDPVREVHFYISGKYVISIHHDHLPILEAERLRIDGRVMHSEQFVVYRVLDALTDTFFPQLAAIDDEIDEIEDAVITVADQTQLQRIFDLKRDLVAMRKVVTPQRDLFARSVDAISDLPGLTVDARDYFRDVYDHLIRISDLIDSYRDLLSGAMDVYLSTVANRQNEVMKQLAVIATIFLPLTFLTGFFGQNFGFLVNHITGEARFLIIGIGSLVISCLALWYFFRRRKWL